jgi:hypothetical protein
VDIILIVLIALHALPGVFWAGSTAALANLAGANAERLFPAQMGSSGLAILTGLGLWAYVRGGSFGPSEQVLAVGIIAAIAAAAVLGRMVGPARRQLATEPAAEPALRRTMATANRIAAVLLMITLVCMVISKYF